MSEFTSWKSGSFLPWSVALFAIATGCASDNTFVGDVFKWVRVR